MTTIEKIKSEIERLYGKYEPKYHETRLPYVEGLLDGFDLIEQFLDTLESEKPGEGLEEEIDLYMEKNYDYNSEYDTLTPNDGFFLSPRHFRNLARHFYEIGCRRTAEKYDEIEYNRQRANESERPQGEDLNEEVKQYYSDNFEYLSSDQPTLSILTNIAHHFAEWGAEHLKK